MVSRPAGISSPKGASDSVDPLIGQILEGRYRIEQVLGEGGVGVVYRAEHLSLHQQVAVKVLHTQFGVIEELRLRFEREGRILSALSHPNIVGVKDYGIANGMPFLVMELLEGRTLADLIDDEGPPPIEASIEIARQVLRGLSFVQGQGIVHRDLKAANVFLVTLPDEPYHVKLLDFGLAKIFASEQGEPDPSLTKMGTILGTPAYMCPEQASGSPVDVRADVYSAGVVLFELLTGRYPFEAPNRVDMLRAHMLEPVPSMPEVRPGLWVSPELDALLRRALAKERDNRFPNAAAMLEALEALPSAAATFLSGQEHGAPLSRPLQATVDTSAATSRPPGSNAISKGVWLSGGLVAILLVAVGIGLAMFLGSPQPDADPRVGGKALGEIPLDEASGGNDDAPAAPEAPSEPPTAVDIVVPPPVVAEPRPEPRDPFNGVRLPSELRTFHVRVRRGHELSRNERRALMAIQRAMPDDPRPTLILAHHFVDLHYFSDAITRYEQAIYIDLASRGDARMMRDLVRMCASEAVSDRAQEFVIRVYGSEAQDEIERAIRASARDPEGLARLVALRRRLPTP